MVGLLLLKQMYDQSDEDVVDRWVENPYWQQFCGMSDWSPEELPEDSREQRALRCENAFVAERLLRRSLAISKRTFACYAASSKASKAINLISCWPLPHGTSANGCGCSPFIGFASYARSLPKTSTFPYNKSPEHFSGPTRRNSTGGVSGLPGKMRGCRSLEEGCSDHVWQEEPEV